MTELIQEKLNAALIDAEQSYYRLILVVGESGSGKTPVLRSFAKQQNTEVINLNRELSERLLGLTLKQRETQLISIIDDILRPKSDPIIMDNIELLFDVNLHNDPLRVLKNLSRHRTIFASWNGVVSQGLLNYAAPPHGEYREYSPSDICVLEMKNRP